MGFIVKKIIRFIALVLLLFVTLNCNFVYANSKADSKDEIRQITSISKNLDSEFNIDEKGVLIGYKGKSKNLIIPENVTAIGSRAFEGRAEIESVTFTENIKAIGESAFCGCSNLKEAFLPESLETIGDSAFAGCKKLEIIYIGENVTEIGKKAFSGCENLYYISVNSDNSCFTAIDGVVYSKDLKKLIYCPEGFEGEIVVDDNTVIVEDRAFFNCRKLNKATIGKSVMYIGKEAFYSCQDLENVILGETLKMIRPHAFERCFKLTEVIIPGSVRNIGDGAFIECGSLKSIKFLNSKTKISGNIISENSKTVIVGYTGSTAEAYAKDKKLTFGLV